MTKVVNGTILDETIAEARDAASEPRLWMVLAGAGVILGLGGPFGTYESLPVHWRVGYWVFVAVTAYWLGYLVSFLAASAAEAAGTGVMVSTGLGAGLTGIAVSAWLAALHGVIFDASFATDFLRLLPYVTVIALTLGTLNEVFAARPAGAAGTALDDADPEWLDQLPGHLGRNLILLQAQDHYVRAQTDRGETLIRSSLRDAADALGSHGVQIHRSWWVARSAVKAYRYRKGVPVIVLTDGMELPVGRIYRRAVRDALNE